MVRECVPPGLVLRSGPVRFVEEALGAEDEVAPPSCRRPTGVRSGRCSHWRCISTSLSFRGRHCGAWRCRYCAGCCACRELLAIFLVAMMLVLESFSVVFSFRSLSLALRDSLI